MSIYLLLLIIALLLFLAGAFGVRTSANYTPNWVALGLAVFMLALLLGNAR